MAPTPAPTARRPSKQRLLATVAVGAVAAVACFSVFYFIGAMVGLAMIALVGVALLAGLVWVSTKVRRAPALARVKPPAIRR